jgi:glyoxylase-like metal-dependent hydrolase (beta-lactamase superfamily II)
VTERIAPGTWVVELPFPQASVVEATNCYLLADAAGGVHLVDPGWDTDATLALLEAGLAAAGFALADVRSVIATHLHPDHLGLGSRLHREHGIPVALHRAEHASLGRAQFPDPDDTLARWGVPAGAAAELRAILEPRATVTGLTGDVVLDDGERLDIPGRDVVVVHTPGHTAGSLCLHDREHDLFFSGDHVLTTVNPGIGLGGFADDDDPIGAALASYAKVAAYDSAEVLPGHGAHFHGLAARATRTADRHRRRSAEIADLAAADPSASIWDIASRVAWTGGWESFAPFLRMTSLTQTEMHLRHLARGTLDG